MFRLAGSVPFPKGQRKHFLCPEVMGLETDEENEIIAPQREKVRKDEGKICSASRYRRRCAHPLAEACSFTVEEWTLEK